MSARYWALVTDDLLAAGVTWPDGLRLADDRGVPRPAGPRVAGLHWHLFEDDGAPAELHGRRVELTLARDDDGHPVIAERRLMP